MLNGAIPTPGQIFKVPKQADVLRKISIEGRKAFYEGEIAEDMVNSLKKLGGSHTLEDFAMTECEYTDPISGKYNDLELVEHPPNGQGATAILMNNILKEFEISNMDPFGSKRAHIEAEAAKLAYDARNRFIADPHHTKRLEHMLSDDTGKKLAKLITHDRPMTLVNKITEQVHRDTIYLTVVDKDLNVVSLIYSIFKSFGERLSNHQH